MFKFNNNCWKICTLSSSLCGKFLDQSKMYWFFGSHSKLMGSIWVHQIVLCWVQLWGLVSPSSNVCFQQNFVELCFPCNLVIVVRFSCQSKVFWMFGSNSSSKARYFWITLIFGGLFLLHTMFVSNKYFWKSYTH